MTAALLVLLLGQVRVSDYCYGWQHGYPKGWCAGEYVCAGRVAPPCPPPVAGKSSVDDGWERGYWQGFNDRERAVYNAKRKVKP